MIVLCEPHENNHFLPFRINSNTHLSEHRRTEGPAVADVGVGNISCIVRVGAATQSN